MNSLGYLCKKRLKNSLLSSLKKPSKLILIILLVGCMGITIFSGSLSQSSALGSTNELTAIVFALLFVMFIIQINTAFSSGASFFSMADVNFLFPSPISSSKILFYGLLQNIGSSMLLGIFILFQYSWLHGRYGLTFWSLLLIFFLYVVLLFVSKLTAMVIYSRTSSNEKAQNTVKYIFYFSVAAIAAYLIYLVFSSGTDYISQLIAAVNKPVFYFIPVAGWLNAIFFGITAKNITFAIAGITAIIVYIAALILIIIKSSTNYYEDVLKSTEIFQNTIDKSKTAQPGEAVPQNIKVGKTGFNKGIGASAIYYKSIIEARRNKRALFGTTTILFIIINIVFCYMTAGQGIIPLLSISTYTLLFDAVSSGWTNEFSKPYIYLIPASPVSKLLQCLKSTFIRFALEAIILYGVASFILKLTALESILCILARIAFSLLATSACILTRRIFGKLTVKSLAMIFYAFLFMVLLIPGITVAVIFQTFGLIGSETASIMLSFLITNLPLSAIIIFCCRNMLQYSELNS